MKEYDVAYFNLYHGTEQHSAEQILQEGFRPSLDGWCGQGVYFYDIKAKAWWAAHNKCRQIKKTTTQVGATVLSADFKKLSPTEIFDLRIEKDLRDFEQKTKDLLADTLKIKGVSDDAERKIKLRKILISYYADKIKKAKLVIGIFVQKPQEKRKPLLEFSELLDIVFGAETIYCVKSPEIIKNIRLGGNEHE